MPPFAENDTASLKIVCVLCKTKELGSSRNCQYTTLLVASSQTKVVEKGVLMT